MLIRKVTFYVILFFGFMIRLYFSFPNCNDKNNICYYKKYENLNVTGVVDSDIDNNNFNLRVFSINNENINGVISVNYYGKKDIKFNEKIKFICSVKNIEGSYKKYLENKNIYLLCNIKDFSVSNFDEELFLKVRYKVFSFAYNIKNVIINRINDVFDNRYSGFLISFLLGDKRFVSKRIENLMIDSGLSHITSISGFNISLIISFIYFLLIFFGVNRRFIFYIITPILFIFSIMTGLNPPVIRACIMSILILFIQQIGIPYKTINILFIVGYVMLIYNPKYILDISFLLSFVSTFAIIFLKPVIDKIIPSKFKFFIFDTLISTILIFILTSPIIYIFFNKLNFLSIINNLLVLPFIPYLYLFSILSLIFKFLCFIPSFIIDYLYLLIGNL